MKRGKNFCILPFNHTAIEANGGVKGCCLTPPFQAPDGRPYNLNTHTLKEALESEDYRGFVQSFQKDERHPYCQKCWEEEDAGSISNRIKFNNQFNRRLLEGDLEHRDLNFLEVKVGNFCNLKCRICGPYNSSKAATEEDEVFSDPTALQYNVQSGWINAPENWDTLAALPIEVIHIMGGEPFIDKTHWPMLEGFVNSGRAKEIDLWYNTNATVFPEKHLPLLSQFKSVSISLSVDDIGKRFEYQRFPAKWEAVRQNLEKYFALERPFKTEIDICWSLFNLFYVDDIFDFYEAFFAQIGRPTDYNLMHGRHFYSGDFFCPKTLRENQRALILDRLESSRYLRSEKYGPLLSAMITHVNFDLYDPVRERNRVDRIKALDKYRNQDFAKYFPELEGFLRI